MADPSELERLPLLPRDEDGPVFAEAWEAQAFAMAVQLSRRGLFTWTEWAASLSAEIAAANSRGEPDRGDTYYHHWLAALEKLAAAKNLLRADELATRKMEWKDAAAHTEFGRPIVLRRDSH